MLCWLLPSPHDRLTRYGGDLRSEPFFSDPGAFSRITLGFPRDITAAWERDADPLTICVFQWDFPLFLVSFPRCDEHIYIYDHPNR